MKIAHDEMKNLSITSTKAREGLKQSTKDLQWRTVGAKEVYNVKDLVKEEYDQSWRLKEK